MERLIGLKPIPGFLVVVGGLVLAGLLGSLVPERFSLSVMNATAAVVYLGWPFLIGIAAEKRVGRRRGRASAIASISFPYLVVFHVVAGVLLADGIDQLAGPTWAAFLGFWMVAVVATFYLLWFGARTLVAAEERRPVRLDQYLGTLLELLVLPIGVLFLQKRVRALLSSPTAA